MNPRWLTRVRPVAWLEGGALLALAVLMATSGARLLAVDSVPALACVVLGLACGHAVADLVTGTAHWLCDRVFDERFPVLGPLLVQGFRDHHDDPLAMTRGDVLAVNGNTALPSIPALLALLAVPEPASAAGLGALAFALGVIGSAVATNQFHAWAHAPSVPRGVAWAQRHHLILSPRAHAVHHDGAYDRAYCVTTGWWNPLLDRLGVFPRLERAIKRSAERPEGATR